MFDFSPDLLCQLNRSVMGDLEDVDLGLIGTGHPCLLFLCDVICSFAMIGVPIWPKQEEW